MNEHLRLLILRLNTYTMVKSKEKWETDRVDGGASPKRQPYSKDGNSPNFSTGDGVSCRWALSNPPGREVVVGGGGGGSRVSVSLLSLFVILEL